MTEPESEKRSDSIAAELRDAILRGTYQPGERLPAERELAQQVSANRASVREALTKLEQLGLVSIRRGGGARVRHLHNASVDVVRHLLRIDGGINPSLALQILDLHEIVVAGSARLAVERASDSELLEARELLFQLDAKDTSEEAPLETIDSLFELITRASDNLVMRMVFNSIRPIITDDLRVLLWRALHPSHQVLHDQIADIANAIQRRDGIATEEAIRSMLRDHRARLVAILMEPESSHVVDSEITSPAPHPTVPDSVA